MNCGTAKSYSRVTCRESTERGRFYAFHFLLMVCVQVYKNNGNFLLAMRILFNNFRLVYELRDSRKLLKGNMSGIHRTWPLLRLSFFVDGLCSSL